MPSRITVRSGCRSKTRTCTGRTRRCTPQEAIGLDRKQVLQVTARADSLSVSCDPRGPQSKRCSGGRRPGVGGGGERDRGFTSGRRESYWQRAYVRMEKSSERGRCGRSCAATKSRSRNYALTRVRCAHPAHTTSPRSSIDLRRRPRTCGSQGSLLPDGTTVRGAINLDGAGRGTLEDPGGDLN